MANWMDVALDEMALRDAGVGHLIGYECVSDTYDPDAGVYKTVSEFRDMCLEVFGEEPKLRITSDNEVYEGDTLILRPIRASVTPKTPAEPPPADGPLAELFIRPIR